MLTSPRLTRRAALAGGAALPLAATLASARGAIAQTNPMMEPNAIKHSFALGDFEVSTLLAGTRTVEDPQTIFGLNASPEEFAAASEANFIPTDKAQFFFTPTVVNTGSEVVLFDTGLAGAATVAALEAAGYGAADVNVVVITHMHGDHIGGLSGDDGTLTFPNARYVTGQVEFDAWAGTGNEGFEAKVRPLAEQMTFLEDGGSVASGITAMAAFGHTPGHMTYMLDSGGQQLLIVGDLANHYVWSLAHPDWEVRFDMDKAAAAASRRRVLGMLAADRVPFIGYHMPFPAYGFVEARGDGFRYVPGTYQFMMQG
jgi:glyoxylase-like metal-dependent hydrolase (beta-lactamase superfamily II)